MISLGDKLLDTTNTTVDLLNCSQRLVKINIQFFFHLN